MLRIDENYNIFLTRGDSATFNVAIYEDDGETPYIMQPGDTLLFTVRRLYDQGKILITKVFNTLSFQLMPSDTAALTTGKYRYDICIYNGTGWIDTFLNNKIFEIGEEVHDFSPPIETLLDRVGEGLPNDDLNILTPVGNLRGALTSGGLIPGVPVIIGEASGNPAHYTDGTSNIYLNVNMIITPQRVSSGTPTPTNPIQLKGYTDSELIISPSADPTEGTTYNIEWSNSPGIVYGGTYDIITGEFRVKYKRLILRASMQMSTPSPGVIWILPSDIIIPPTSLAEYVISSHYRSRNQTESADNNTICKTHGNKVIIIIDNANATTLENYKDFCELQYSSGTPIEVVYRMNDDIIYNLPSIPIMGLEGENYVWSEIGNVDLKYIANMQTFLQWIYDNLYNP